MKIHKIFTFTLLAVAFLFTNCGGKKKSDDTEVITDKDNPLTVMEKASKNVEKMQEQTNELEKIAQERRAKGDTVPLNYKDLRKFLPESIAGYAKEGEPGGESTQSMGFVMSNASQNYKKGESTLKIEITDFSAMPTQMQSYIGLVGMFAKDSDEERVGKVDLGIDGVKAYETFQKKNKNENMILAYDNRYYVKIDVSGADNVDETAKSIAKSIDWNKMKR